MSTGDVLTNFTLPVVVSRFVQFKFPLLDDLLWLLNIQGLLPYFSLEHIFGTFEIVEGDKMSSILGYISSVINLGQYWQKIKEIPKFTEYIIPPYCGIKNFNCSKCNTELSESCKVNNEGRVFCESCLSVDGRVVYIG